MSRSAYHLGFWTLDKETRSEALAVEGTLPRWLSGTLIRTTPAMFEVGEQRYHHWFDGLAMLYKFTFSNHRVSFANRYLRSQSYCEALQQGKISRSEFATNPRRTLFEHIKAWFSPPITDNGNVSINKLGDHTVALTESPYAVRFEEDVRCHPVSRVGCAEGAVFPAGVRGVQL